MLNGWDYDNTNMDLYRYVGKDHTYINKTSCFTTLCSAADTALRNEKIEEVSKNEEKITQKKGA
jgi:hypothetical protein